VSALNLVAYPLESLGPELLTEILRGGLDACTEAGCAVLGGHTIDDPEPKYGLSVTGVVHPDALLTNAGGRPGDQLVLTKPLGTGTVATAIKRGLADERLIGRAVEVMTTLNDVAARNARAAGARALTDVTGFGLLGHLHELALASDVAAEIDSGKVPAIERGVVELLEQGVVAGGTRRNHEHAATFTHFADDVLYGIAWLLCDAMTSGGLLAAIPPGATMEGWVIGRLVEGPPGEISVLGLEPGRGRG
jgi:selenide,water dikinase